MNIDIFVNNINARRYKMHRFYVKPEQVQDEKIKIEGQDLNHIKRVLRMVAGDELVICNGQSKDYHCKISEILDGYVLADIMDVYDTNTELKCKITLFQALPKSDKMELIIQKAIELGVYEIVPVMTKRTIVKLKDKKKEAKKQDRWAMIAESAAKQSGRGIIPRISPVISFEDAIKRGSTMDLALIPYEKAVGIDITRDLMKELKEHKTIGIYIGPEGGFEEAEIKIAKANNIIPISLGKRILRTETASLAILSMMMLALEE